LNKTSPSSKTDEDPEQINYIKFTALPTLKPLISEWMGDFYYLHNNGTQFFYQTNYNAPNSKVIKIDIADPSAQWVDVIPESSDMIMESYSVMDGKMVVKYLVNASDSL
jgi:prolyl oligopeptidase